jgi:pyridoxine 5'-phosphate synthase PdxJ
MNLLATRANRTKVGFPTQSLSRLCVVVLAGHDLTQWDMLPMLEIESFGEFLKVFK